MPKIWIARRTQRMGFYLPMQGTEKKPNLMFFLTKMGEGHLDQLVRSELEKQGVTDEGQIHSLIEQAEKDYEHRVKTQETIKELRRLMAIKAAGGKLMQMGFRKWKQVFYRPIAGK